MRVKVILLADKIGTTKKFLYIKNNPDKQKIVRAHRIEHKTAPKPLWK